MSIKVQQFLAVFSFALLTWALVLLGSLRHMDANRAVYHWKTNFQRNSYDSYEDSFLSRHQIKKMYVKMLDVDYSEAAGIFPASKTFVYYYMNRDLDSMEYVPVVYITNRVLEHLSAGQMDYYAKNIIGHALRIETHTRKPVHEIQVDCDWTKGTKDTYFNLLKCIRDWAPQYQYSATLRLFPFKYREELGIPPVDRVMLMVYNIDNAKKYKAENSIFSVREAAKYLRRKVYPLPMDYALPVFSWTIVFRNQQFLKVLSSDVLPELVPNPGENAESACYRMLQPNLYLFMHSDRGKYTYGLKAGDILKVESCGEKELLEASALIAGLKNTDRPTISLFDLDENDLRKIADEKIEAAYTPVY